MQTGTCHKFVTSKNHGVIQVAPVIQVPPADGIYIYTVSEGYLDQVGYLDQNFDLDSKLTEALKLSFFM